MDQKAIGEFSNSYSVFAPALQRVTRDLEAAPPPRRQTLQEPDNRLPRQPTTGLAGLIDTFREPMNCMTVRRGQLVYPCHD